MNLSYLHIMLGYTEGKMWGSRNPSVRAHISP